MVTAKNIKLSYIYFVIFLLIITGCKIWVHKTIFQECVFLDSGVSGGTMLMERSLTLEIDSLCINSDEFELVSFDLEIIPVQGKSKTFSSRSNKLTPNMRAALIDHPAIKRLEFKNFTFSNNGKAANEIINIYIIH